MFIQLLSSDHHQSITAYTTNSVVIAGHEFQQSFMVGTELAPRIWNADSLIDFSTVQFEQLLINSPQIILIGAGTEQQFLDPTASAFFYKNGIGFEMMALGAACRTYNILINEGRRITAGFLLN